MATKLCSEQKKTNSKSTANKSDTSMKPSTSKSATITSSTLTEKKIQDMCIAEGCNKVAVTHPEWDNEYCSIECCYNHCKTVFRAWLAANKVAKMKANAASLMQENTAGPSNQSESVKP